MVIASDTLVSIEFTGTDLRLNGHLLGQRHKHYLIIGLPSTSSLKGMLLPNSLVTIRYIVDGTAYGFNGEIINFISKPEAIVFVEYPEKVESLQIRKSQRISTNIPTVAELNDRKIEGVIIDLSSGGCRMMFHEDDHDFLKTNIKGDEELNIKFYALEEKNNYEATGKITSIADVDKRFTFGLKFSEKDSAVSDMVQKYIDKLSRFLEQKKS